jgi:hypothetical protein
MKRLTLRKITPGQVVRREFTPAEIARGLGVNESTPWRWAAGGLVPSVHHVSLLQMARDLRRNLTPDDLVLGRHK